MKCVGMHTVMTSVTSCLQEKDSRFFLLLQYNKSILGLGATNLERAVILVLIIVINCFPRVSSE